MSLAKEGTHPLPNSDIKMKKTNNQLKKTINDNVSLVKVFISVVQNLFCRTELKTMSPGNHKTSAER